MTLSHPWVSMSLLMRILISIILMSLKYPCLWVFKDPSIDFEKCYGYLCKYLWQIYRLESIFVTCQDLKMNINDFSHLRYSIIIIIIDNCMISISSLLNTCEYLLNNPWVYDYESLNANLRLVLLTRGSKWNSNA